MKSKQSTVTINNSCVEAGWNTSTVALRVVRGDGKGTQFPGVYLSHPVRGECNYGDLALQVAVVSRIGTIKYGIVSHGSMVAK
jgi:hypothetical protein